MLLNSTVTFSTRLMLVGSLLSLFGCASPIHIISPTATPANAPVTQIKVHFTDNFKPSEAWSISIDGTKIAGFSPTPAPGVTSFAPLPLAGGHKVCCGTPDPGDVGRYDIETNATCGFFCVYDSEKVTIVPLALIQGGPYWISGLNVIEFVPTLQTVRIQTPTTVAIQVTVKDETSPNPILRLGLTSSSILPLGSPLVVTIPAGKDFMTFYTLSVIPAPPTYAPYHLTFKATGVTPGYGVGNVIHSGG